jgi:type I restriction enzyme R subunit
LHFKIEWALNQQAYGILKLLEVVANDNSERLKNLALDIDALYSSDQTAPIGWQNREQLRKELRQQVREIVHSFGVVAFKEVPIHVEEYALKHYAKVV